MVNKSLLRTAGLAAGLLGLVVLAPSAFAQYQEQGSFWNGATPTAPGPAPAGYGYGPNYGGWAPGFGGNNAGGVAGPYWHGAPQAIGPGS
jgi:hypothetical protein